MPDKDQFGIYSKDELSLIKNTFAENDILLYSIRKVFMQFPLSDAEKNLIKLGVTPEVHRVLKKRMLPDPSPEYPLGQIPDLLSTLQKDIGVKDAEAMADLFAAKKLEIDYLAQQFAVLQDLEAPQPIILADLSKITGDAHETFITMNAYLFLLGYIDPSLHMIKVLAGTKDETPEQQEKRIKRDSTQ